ncbi:MAG TPA: hypothetical protein VFU27_06040 [Terriglobales bacterium]|nr:hypothetical protein [Terriglobales bacterium]
MRLLFLCAAVLVFCATPALAQGRSAGKTDVVHTCMRNVVYHYTPSIAVHIVELSGWLTPAAGHGLVFFDDNRSFVLHIAAADMSISTEAMTHILNEYIFAAPDAPLKALSISANGRTLKITGKLHSHGDIPFEDEGVLSLTPRGEIRIHSTRVKAAHLPVKTLMSLLGIHISGLISHKKVRGVRAEKDDLLLNPEEILPLPRIQGRLTSVEVAGNAIVEHFGGRVPGLAPGNYMDYRGGRFRFGKLTMNDADMELIDMDQRDPFDFYLARYKEQLVAGYTKTTSSFGLRVFMPDYDKLPRKK